MEGHGEARGEAEQSVARVQDASGLTRRRLLQAAGVGAAGAALPVVGDGRVDAAGNQLPKYLRNGRFGIGLHWAAAAGASAEEFAAVADSGVNLLVLAGANGHGPDKHMLDLAHQSKLRCIARSPELFRLATARGAALPQRTEWPDLVSEAVTRLAGHPAVVGFQLDDEAHADLFGRQAYLVDLLRTQAPELLSLIRLAPSDATPRRLHALDYAEYLNRFSQVGVPLVAAGHLPMPGTRGERAGYFGNWAAARADARRRAVPLWGTLEPPDPGAMAPESLRELLWQANVALVYGATSLSFTTAIVGSLAPIRSVNRQWLQPVGDELAMMRSELVQHTDAAGAGDEPYRSDGWIEAVAGSPVIVGSFTSRLRRDRRFAMVVNERPDQEATITLRFGAEIHRVARFDPAEEEYRSMPGQATAGRNSLRLGLAAGAAVLLRMTRGR